MPQKHEMVPIFRIVWVHQKCSDDGNFGEIGISSQAAPNQESICQHDEKVPMSSLEAAIFPKIYRKYMGKLWWV